MNRTDVRLAAGAALFVAFNALLFYTPAYRSLIAPDSSTGTFDRVLQRVDRVSHSRTRDILVLGDSRTTSDLDEVVADNSAGEGLRFINAGVPGATPRCWTVFDRAIDPEALRYRAVVIPVDSYNDDDGSIGSVDGNDRSADLHYIVNVVSPSEILKIAASFPTLDGTLNATGGLVLRGPILRADVQSLLANPQQRIAALRASRVDWVPHLRVGSLKGLKVDFAHDTFVSPPGMQQNDRQMLVRQIFHRATYSEAYARYRREWLGYLVHRYRARGVPVIFVRLPTRPLHRAPPPPPSGTIVAFSAEDGARLLRQTPYVALERPRYFVDADHLNVEGARAFSKQLSRDVRDVLDGNGVSELIEVGSPRRQPAIGRSDGAVGWHGLGVPIAFQSYEFILFVILIAVCYRFLPSDRLARVFVLLASWYFYARWNAWYLVVLIALTTIDYSIGLYVRREDARVSRSLLTLGIAIDLAFLGTAKYADFFSKTISGLLGMSGNPWALHVLVPVGISFHTFQSISYLVDVSKGRVKPVRSFVDYALYLAFFPQLLAGPIVRAATFFGELIQRRSVDAECLAFGFRRIVLGLIKKSVLADRFAASSDAYFGSVASHPGALSSWTGALAFALQIYFDFSGYSDIAIGAAALFGLRFPENFNRPYFAWTVSDFWRRWHMTLSSWLRDYLYIPLGGSHGTAAATVRNLLVTMLLGGLWHGADWTFVIWGGYHGVLLAFERVSGYSRFIESRLSNRALRISSTAGMFILVLIGWVLFRTENVGDALFVLREMITGGVGASSMAAPAMLLGCVALALEGQAERFRRATFLSVTGRVSMVAAVLGVLELASYPDASAPFVYFRF